MIDFTILGGIWDFFYYSTSLRVKNVNTLVIDHKM
jgi:hypothetical protein